MFYEIKKSARKKSTLKGIGAKNIKERDVQNLVENNLDTLFGLEFVATEFQVSGVRFDTLAFDRENNVPVIIEFKKDIDKSLFDQGLEYLNVLLTNKEALTLALSNKLSITSYPNEISWENAKIIFISSRYTDRQKRAISFQGLPIELWNFEWLENDCFRIEKEDRFREAKLSELTKDNKRHSGAIQEVQKEIPVYDSEYFKKSANPNIWDIFEKTKDEIQYWSNFDIRYRKNYICFHDGKSFCAIKLLKTKIQVEFGRDTAKDRKFFQDLKMVRDISSKDWNHSFMVEGSNENDLTDLFFALKKAHELFLKNR